MHKQHLVNFVTTCGIIRLRVQRLRVQRLVRHMRVG